MDFNNSPMPGYYYAFQYADGDPFYDVRWAVITELNGQTITSKRFILGVHRLAGGSYVPPVTLDSVVER